MRLTISLSLLWSKRNIFVFFRKKIHKYKVPFKYITQNSLIVSGVEGEIQMHWEISPSALCVG
jgi:hypothetical protein